MLKAIIDQLYEEGEFKESMKVILLEDVKSLGKKGRNRKCQRRICKKYDPSKEAGCGSDT